MSKEVNELLDKLGKLEDAPLIWINKKVYDASKEIERLKKQLQQKENIIKEVREYTSKTQMPEGYKKMVLEILDKGE